MSEPCPQCLHDALIYGQSFHKGDTHIPLENVYVNEQQEISQDELEWRLELIRRLSWGQLIEHITVNHLWRSQHGVSPADLYAIPTARQS